MIWQCPEQPQQYFIPDPDARRFIGLCQQLSDNAPEQHKLCHEKFEHFNETINGVLFVKNASHPACYGDLILDLDLGR